MIEEIKAPKIRSFFLWLFMKKCPIGYVIFLNIRPILTVGLSGTTIDQW